MINLWGLIITVVMYEVCKRVKVLKIPAMMFASM